MQKYFIDREIQINYVFPIEESDHHHIEKVMRYKNGDEIICIYNGIQYLCRIVDVSKGFIEPIKQLETNNELDVHVTLVYALPKGDKFEFVLQKACELGVSRIVPLQSKRCVVKLTKDKFDKKRARFEKILKEASEQSSRNIIPELIDVKTIKDIQPYLGNHNLIAYEETAKNNEHGELFHTLQQVKAGDSIVVFVGCEGGFDESEVKELNAMGVKCCSLGKRILRSETAPLYLLSVIGYSREVM